MDGVHIVTSANCRHYEAALEQSYRLRHRIYIQELKWRGLPPRDDGRELDQFDTAEAVHLLYLEGDRVLGGTRLVPTTEPHLLSEVFAHFASIRGVPRQPDIAEWTRFYVAPERRAEGGPRLSAPRKVVIMRRQPGSTNSSSEGARPHRQMGVMVRPRR